MDRFFDRLGDILKDFLGSDSPRNSSSKSSSFGDPDLTEAMEELDDFLYRNRERQHNESSFNKSQTGNTQQSFGSSAPNNYNTVPEQLRPDFLELGVPFGSNMETCKNAYKALLKKHHPDKHANHEGNLKKATAKTSKINESYTRIEDWWRQKN